MVELFQPVSVGVPGGNPTHPTPCMSACLRQGDTEFMLRWGWLGKHTSGRTGRQSTSRGQRLKTLRQNKMSSNKKTNLRQRRFRGCFLSLCLFFIMQSQHFFCLCGGITQWPILIALFSQCVPTSHVCYCRTGRYAGPAQSEHSLSNNSNSCGV